MLPVLSEPNRTSRLVAVSLSLVFLGAPLMAQQKQPAPQPQRVIVPEGTPYNSAEYRFRMVFPGEPRITLGRDQSTIFSASTADERYTVRIVIIPLDQAAVALPFDRYFAGFARGMKLNNAELTECGYGLVSNADAMRCVVRKYGSDGMMITVRRGGVVYVVSAEQRRGDINQAQIVAAIGTFRLMPELVNYTFAAQNFRAQFPARPKLTEIGGGTLVKAYAARRRYMTMVAIEPLSDAEAALEPARFFAAFARRQEQALRQNKLRLTECAAVEFVGGYPASYCTYEDEASTGGLLLVRRDKQIYSVLAHQPRGNGSSAEIDGFIRSFKFLK